MLNIAAVASYESNGRSRMDASPAKRFLKAELPQQSKASKKSPERKP
jgi:hypothetical protein